MNLTENKGKMSVKGMLIETRTELCIFVDSLLIKSFMK